MTTEIIQALELALGYTLFCVSLIAGFKIDMWIQKRRNKK